MNYLRKCQVCGNEYKYCVYCEEFNHEPKWRMLFDTDNCRKIFHAVSDYLVNEIDANEAKKILSECDISNPNRFNENVKKVIQELFQNENSTEKIVGNPAKRMSSRKRVCNI